MAGVFYPSARVQLAIRLEEFDDTGSLVARLMERPATRVAEAGGTVLVSDASTASVPTVEGPATDGELEAQLVELDARIVEIEDDPAIVATGDPERALANLRAQREAVLGRLGVPASGPEPGDAPVAIDGPPPDGRVVLGGIVPRSVQIERNGLRSADTATVVLNHTDAPFDPRLIRGAAIEITLGIVEPDQFAAGVAGARRSDGTLVSMVERSRELAGPEGRTANTTRFIGWVDDWQIMLDGKEGDTISLECRDLSALFFDTQLATGDGVDLTRPIDAGVQDFLGGYVELEGINVVWGRPGALNPGTAPTPGDAVPITSRPGGGDGARARRTGDQQQNLWDHITEVTARVGLVPVLYDYELHIVEPRTYFTGSDVARRMVYGRNLRHLEFTRKLGGVRVPTIEVRCYDPTIGRTRWARYPGSDAGVNAGVFGETDPPRAPRRANVPTVSGHNPTERIQTYLVTGVNDGAVLYRVARNLFEQIGRQEIEGNLETDDVQSVEPSDGAPADVLSLDTGDAVELLVSGGPNVPDASGMTAAQIQALSRDARSEYLQRIGWSEQVADRFAELQDATANQTVFRVQNVRLSWDQAQGFTATVDFINFIEVREEAGSAGVEGVPSATVADDTGLPPDVAALVSRATEGLGDRVRDAYRESGVFADRMEAGEVSPDEFADGAARSDEEIPAATAAAEEGGSESGPPV